MITFMVLHHGKAIARAHPAHLMDPYGTQPLDQTNLFGLLSLPVKAATIDIHQHYLVLSVSV